MKIIFYTLFISASLFACSSATSEQSTSETDAVIQTEATEQQAPDALAHYMTLKDALVKSDAGVAKTAATELGTSLTSEKMDAKMIEAANMIASTDDLKAQRIAFKTITDGLIKALKANEIVEGVYVQYCPMAFDNTGANWISMSEEIRNPYYGDMMLKCGRVTGQL
jgi:hypothetical protein